MTDQIPAEAYERFLDSFNGDEAGDIDLVQSYLGDTGHAMRGGNDVRAVFDKATAAILPFLRPEPSEDETHRPGDEIDGTVYCSCGDGDYGAEGHRPEPSEDEQEALERLLYETYQDAAGVANAGPAWLYEFARHYAGIILAAGFTRRPVPSREQITLVGTMNTLSRHDAAYTRNPHTHDAWWGCGCGERYDGPRDESTSWHLKHRADAVLALFKGAEG